MKTTMALSHAIRLGAMMKPQAFGSTVTANGDTCARGAALDAIGLLADTPSKASARWYDVEAWFWTQITDSVCPVANCPSADKSGTVQYLMAYHLNDYHRWSRERIADWIELHEPEAMLPERCEAELPEIVSVQS